MKTPSQSANPSSKTPASLEQLDPAPSPPETSTSRSNSVLSRDDQGRWMLSPSHRVGHSISNLVIEWKGEKFLPIPDRRTEGCNDCAFDGVGCTAIPCGGVIWKERGAAIKWRLMS